MKKTISYLILFFCSSIYTQHPNILVGPPAGNTIPQEPSIAIHPGNPQQMVIGTNPNHIYTSDDGGHTWTKSLLHSTHGIIGDPCILSEADHGFFYFHIGDLPGGKYIDRMVCQHLNQTDGAWTNGTAIGSEQNMENDKEWAACDPDNGLLYITWTQFEQWASRDPNHHSRIVLSRSDDWGATFSPPVRVSHTLGDATGGSTSNHISMPAIGPNGEVYVVWHGPEGIMFNRSLDRGETWLAADVLTTTIPSTPSPGRWIYNVPGVNICKGFPILACDRSHGPHRGTLFIGWADQRSGKQNTDVWLIKSTDRGDSWSNLIRINDDANERHQFFPWITVDQSTGFLYALFYDRRHYGITSYETDVFMAISRDGGETFDNFKVSETSFMAHSAYFYGDYIQVAACQNVIRPVWTRFDNNRPSIMTALVDIEQISPVAPEIQPGLPQQFHLYPLFPNPFNNSTTISYRLEKRSLITLSVVDVSGRKQVTLLHGTQDAGAHAFLWQTDDMASGIYLVLLKSDNRIETQKVTLMQ